MEYDEKLKTEMKIINLVLYPLIGYTKTSDCPTLIANTKFVSVHLRIRIKFSRVIKFLSPTYERHSFLYKLIS